MSCGEPDDKDCAEVLDHLYEYLDNEMETVDRARIQQHIDDCGPCLDKYGLEQSVKALVHRSCGCDEVPTDLRDKVLSRIKEIKAHTAES